MSSSSGHDDDPYPPWLEPVLDEESTSFDEVVVMEAGNDGGKYKDWRQVKHIVVPDAFDAASGKGAGECRTFHVKRYSTILIASAPDTPPYIGLVHKVFRRRGAQKVREVNGKPVYRQGDFGIQAYWFYRPSETPPDAWGKHLKLRKVNEGKAHFKLPGVNKELLREDYSEKEVQFSSHHTLHDYPEQQGILALDGFLQGCKVHWLGSPPPEQGVDHPRSLVPQYGWHKGELLKGQPPGFVVRSFLWCGAKEGPQLDARYKQTYKLKEYNWPDQETCAIARHCMDEYQKTTRPALFAHNLRLMTRAHAAQQANPDAPVPSDDWTDSGDDNEAAGAPGHRDTPSHKHTDHDQAAGAPSSRAPSRPSAIKQTPHKAAAAAAAAAGGAGSTPSRPSAKKPSPRKAAAAAAGGAGSSKAGGAGSTPSRPSAKKPSPGKAAAAAMGGAGSSKAAAAQGSSPRLEGVSDVPSAAAGAAAAGAAPAPAVEYQYDDDILHPVNNLDIFDESD